MTLTLEQFITKANTKHKNKYDYSETKYVNHQTDVNIICKEHGIFTQRANDHLSGSGCPTCDKNKKRDTTKLTLEGFIERSNIKHNNVYDYSYVVYINNRTEVKIKCDLHGIFKQTPRKHLIGQGCSKCFGNKKYSTVEFIKEAQTIHGDKYNYSKVKYINSTTEVTIICNIHGDFDQRPGNHLNQKSECPQCALLSMAKKQSSTKEEFINKSKEIFGNKYLYDKVVYKNNRTNVLIGCRIHGYFNKSPDNHLFLKQGCPKCSPAKHSKKAIAWLDYMSDIGNIEIRHAENNDNGEFKIPKSNYKADGYCEKTNTIYEFHGCIYHGCPKCFNKNDTSPITHTKYKDLYQKTMDKENFIRSHGYILITIWEHDWNYITKNITINNNVCENLTKCTDKLLFSKETHSQYAINLLKIAGINIDLLGNSNETIKLWKLLFTNHAYLNRLVTYILINDH